MMESEMLRFRRPPTCSNSWVGPAGEGGASVGNICMELGRMMKVLQKMDNCASQLYMSIMSIMDVWMLNFAAVVQLW